MGTTLPETSTRPRISAVSEETRTDLSALIGADVELLLGPDGESADDEQARLAALFDMITDGFLDVPDVLGRLLVVEAELDLADAEALAGWAA